MDTTNEQFKSNTDTDEIRWVARKMYRKFHSSPVGNFITYEIDDFDTDMNAPSYFTQLDSVLFKMREIGAIKIHSEEFKRGLSKRGDETMPNLFKIELIKPLFDQLYGKYDEHRKSNKQTPPLTINHNPDIEISAGDLAAYKDGTIRYKGEIIDIRPQLKDLCRLFVENQNHLITYDDILDTIIDADKRAGISKSTISKYVSKLHNSLKIHFRKKVIFNHPKEGWHFDPTK